ncbi:recombinase family protein [Gordonia sp. ABSL1-1]|uniref:recombinase family protein n=1 Tax=Gordonia sp. ABSL1-1 TaxID=3053923 RepID=UPI002573D055|nr:recombinase family protein [Gordonia sp. ABSL1-1]MDL9936417.1 recombinase family protein [Gordonia sp. ABSL1-1]
MKSETPHGAGGALLGYARSGIGTESLAAQIDELADVGVAANRIYSDHGPDAPAPRPGLIALLDYARAGDTTVVTGIDRLGRTVDEVLATTRELTRRDVAIRSLREGIDSSDRVGSMIIGVLSSLAELDDETGRTRLLASSPRRPHGSAVGRPRALDEHQVALAEQMRAGGESVPAIAAALGVSRATLYRSLADRRSA